MPTTVSCTLAAAPQVSRRSALHLGTAAGTVALIGIGAAPAMAATATGKELTRLLDLPLKHRAEKTVKGGVHPALPYKEAKLKALVALARKKKLAPKRYAALLLQYRLVQACKEAGIDLASWDPNTTLATCKPNMIKSYRYYENFQLKHRELQWAGMGGQVGADFGAGIEDMELAANLYGLPGIADLASGVIRHVRTIAGPAGVECLPRGLKDLAEDGDRITRADLAWFIRKVLVMQKAIFSDLMPQHLVYSREGLKGLKEMHRAGIFGDDIMRAWRDIASGSRARVSAGNAVLLRREQEWVVGTLWRQVRGYRNGVGEILTFLTTFAGSPSVAGVPALREYKPVKVSLKHSGVAVQLPIPDWDWSIFEDRWDFITHELLPRYDSQVNTDWPTLQRELSIPYEIQWVRARPIMNVPKILISIISGLGIVPAS